MRKALGALIIAAAAVLMPTVAHAAGEDYTSEYIQEYTASYYVNADGTTDVTVDFTYNYNGIFRHGPYISLITRQGYDSSNDRFYDVSDVRASSPSGAPSRVYLDQGDYRLAIRIGDENISDVTGIQQYRLTYTIDAALNDTRASDIAGATPADDDPHLWDEFYWNVIGDQWTVPLANVTIHISGDAAIVPVSQDEAGSIYTGDDVTNAGVYCFSGSYGSSASCTGAMLDASGATFTQDWVNPYEPVTVLVAFPAGSVDTTPRIRTKNDIAYALSINPATGAGALAVLGGGIVLLSRRIRGSAIDEQFAGLTPGLAPVGTGAARVVKRDYKAPVAVQFEPPVGMRPGQLGTLMDERADVRDVTATIVDLAVRGYLRIDEIVEEGKKRKKKPDYRFIKLRDADDGLVKYERLLFDGLFDKRDEIELSDLKTTFASDLAKVQAQMYRNVTALGWFRSNPNTTRNSWVVAGIFILIAGLVLTFVVGGLGPWALIPLPIALVGIMVIATTKNAPARKAEGTRVLVQAQGFQTFLETADGNKLRFEEGHDLFSAYLPFAIAFGVADKWSAVFEKLAKQGANLAEPTWYGGTYGHFWANSAGFGDRMTSFASIADAAISAPTPGSSGGSGFSSGGGFSGGGGGGGGGGSW